MMSDPTIPEAAWPRIEAAIVGAFEKALGRLPGPVQVVMSENVQDGSRFCALCHSPLSSVALLAQAEKLLEPFAGMKLEAFEIFEGAVKAEIAEILKRAAGPFNAGLDCCYSCAYDLNQSVTLELVQ